MKRSLARYASGVRCLLILAVVVAGGCDLVWGLDLGAAPDASLPGVDAVPDAHPMFGAPMTVTLDCPAGGSAIDLSLDLAEQRFIYACAGIGIDIDIYEAAVKDALTGDTARAVVMESGTQGSPEMSPDGLEVYYLLLRTGIGEIFLKRRPTIGAAWGASTLAPDVLNTDSDDRPGPPDATGTRFMITRSSPPSSVLVEVVREGARYSESATSSLALRPPTSPINPQISADGRTLVFAALGDGSDLFVAQRSNLDSPWGTAIPIPEVNTSLDETDPWLSADGRRLYFTRGGVIFLARK